MEISKISFRFPVVLVLMQVLETSADGAPNRLHLSPYELAQLTDLIIEISKIRCPTVSRPLLKSFKTYMYSTFENAPKKAVSHPLFFKNYRTLVNCLSYTQDNFSTKARKTSNRKENGKIKRSITLSEEANGYVPKGQEGFEKFHNGNGIKEMFDLLHSIVRISCPSDLAADDKFLTAGLDEATFHAEENSLASLAFQKYFKNGQMISDMEECYDDILSSLASEPE